MSPRSNWLERSIVTFRQTILGSPIASRKSSKKVNLRLDSMESRDVPAPLAGFPDTQFGGDGIVTTKIDLGGDFRDDGRSVAIQNDGKVVVVGTVDRNPTGVLVPNRDMIVLRYNKDGSLDTSFGDFVNPEEGIRTGYTILAFDIGGKFADEAAGIAIQGRRIVVAGTAFKDDAKGTSDFVVARLTKDGELDRSFGDRVALTGNKTGWTAIDFNSLDLAAGVAIHTGGIVVAGTVNDDVAVARVNIFGKLDAKFGTAGKFTYDVDGADVTAGVAVQGSKIVIASTGDLSTGGSPGIFVSKVNADGTPNAEFGKPELTFQGATGTQAAAIAVRGGKIAVAGTVTQTVGALEKIGVAQIARTGTQDWSTVVEFTDGQNDSASGVAFQGSKVVVLGTVVSATGDTDLGVARLLGTGPLAGTLDRGNLGSQTGQGFGDLETTPPVTAGQPRRTGKQTIAFDLGDQFLDFAGGVAVRNGRIVAVGSAQFDGDNTDIGIGQLLG